MKLSKPFSVSVIMPTFNEGGHIQELIRETETALLNTGIEEYEIIVVDDDSPDLTWAKAEAVPGVDPQKIKVIRRMHDRGLTASLRDGVAASRHEVVLWMDCDFSHPPGKIPQLLYMIEQGYDVAVNSRYLIGAGEDRSGKGGAMQLVLSRLLNWGIRFALKPAFSDYTSGFIAVRRYVVDKLSLRGDYGEYFIDFIYRVMRSGQYRVCEMPFVAPPRRSGESKTGTNLWQYLRRGWKYMWVVFKLRVSNPRDGEEAPPRDVEPGP